jgi:hypothetical protein
MSMPTVIEQIATHLGVEHSEAELIVDKAIAGGEAQEANLNEWLQNRFMPNTVLINEQEYAQMCIDALKILGRTAATDFGSSRQRDLGQLWADMTRGYLGEYAFKKFLKEKWNLDADLGHEEGELADYLPIDIHKIKEPESTDYRAPLIKIGIKAVKWNGIWFDIPGDQFNHSDIHVLVKVGTARDHLFAFFKKISVFKDKILRHGQDIGCLSADEADTLFDKLPTFRPIPAYICGFVKKDFTYARLSYSGKKGRKNYTIKSWKGPISAGDLEEIKNLENVSGSVKFEGIQEFSHENGYLFNTGNLLWEQPAWEELRRRL